MLVCRTAGGLMSVLSTAKKGDELAALIAVRDDLASRLDGCEDKEAASIAKQLRDTLQRISQIAPDDTADTLPTQIRNRHRSKRG